MEFLDSIKTWPKATKDYYNELKLEMRRVTWPNRKQVEGTTMVVIFTVFAFGLYFAVVDAILTDSITRMYRVLAK